jgi:hypothetical protein
MATAYVKLKGRQQVFPVSYTIGPVFEDIDAIKLGWYRNSFQPQPIAFTPSSSASVQVGGGQSAQYVGGSYAGTGTATAFTLAIPDEMQSPPVAPRTLEHGKTFMVFYGSTTTSPLTATRSSNTLVVGSGHGLLNGQLVTVATTSALPAGLLVDTLYYVVGRTSTAISLALTPGGSAITLSDAGTGTHTVVAFGRTGLFDMADGPLFCNTEPLGLI